MNFKNFVEGRNIYSGWLILPFIGLCFSPFGILFDLISVLNLDEETSESIGSLFLSNYILLNITVLIMILYVGYNFFNRKKDTPTFYKYLMVVMAIESFLIYCLWGLSPVKEINYEAYSMISNEYLKNFVIQLIGNSVWFLYFSRSKRVVETFTN